MRWTTLIFDLDGTLLDTLADLAAAANMALERRGLPSHPEEAYRRFIGHGVEHLMRSAIGTHPELDHETSQCLKAFRETYSLHWNIHSQPYEGVPKLLDHVSAADMTLSVLSNKPQEFTAKCVAHYFSEWQFQSVVGMRDGVPKKPAPDAVHEILQAQGRSVEQCVYIGDSDVDMQTAKNAGVSAIGAAWGFRGAEELLSAGADYVAERPLDLITLLDRA